jgi:hypothetical protein
LHLLNLPKQTLSIDLQGCQLLNCPPDLSPPGSACEYLSNSPFTICDSLNDTLSFVNATATHFFHTCDTITGTFGGVLMPAGCRMECTIVTRGIVGEGVQKCVRTVGNRALTNGT